MHDYIDAISLKATGLLCLDLRNVTAKHAVGDFESWAASGSGLGRIFEARRFRAGSPAVLGWSAFDSIWSWLRNLKLSSMSLSGAIYNVSAYLTESKSPFYVKVVALKKPSSDGLKKTQATPRSGKYV